MQQFSIDQFRDYRRTLIRLYLGHWIGGFPLGSIKRDFELIGLSRDAILMIFEAFLKAGLALLSIFSAGSSTIEVVNLAGLLSAMPSLAGLNI